MKTIKVFVASSEELENERKEIIVLFDFLNDIFEKRGFRLKYSGWEKIDESMGRERKQQEYNNEIKTCDICLVLYWTKVGDYTNEELETAYNELKEGNKPYKLYIYFKEIGELTPEVQAFKASFEKQYGHFYGKFENIDALKLRFLLQLEKYQNSGAIKVEDSVVKVDGYAVANFENVSFVANNERYKELKESIEDIKEDIALYEEKYKEISSEATKKKLDKKRMELHRLNEELAKHEQAIFDTAVRMAQYEGKCVSARMQHAIELFEAGKISEANILLGDVKGNADASLAEYRKAMRLLNVNKENILTSIDELLLSASIMPVDTAFEPDERIELTDSLYEKAIDIAHECGVDKEKCSDILKDYYRFLERYAKYEKAMAVAQECLLLDKHSFGERSKEVAQGYNNIGIIYNHQRNYLQALDSYHSSLEIRLEVLGDKHPDVAKNYNNIGVAYYNQGEYDLAMVNYQKSLEICLDAFGECYPDVASTYNNMGVVCCCQNRLEEALGYYDKAREIYLQTSGELDPDIAQCLNNIGNVYFEQKKYQEALEMYEKALDIRLRAFGTRHFLVSTSYQNLALVCRKLGDYPRALENYNNSYEVLLDIFGENDSRTLAAIENIANTYLKLGDIGHAMESINKGAAAGSEKCINWLKS